MELDKLVEKYAEGDLKIDIGCGTRKRPGWTGCDFIGSPDVLMDLRTTWPFRDNTVGTIYSHHVLEHFQASDLIHIFSEAWRVLEPDGCLIAVVPHGHSDLAVGDPQHLFRWLEWTPKRFCSQIYDKSQMGQGLDFKPWIVEEVVAEPHKDFASYSKEAFFFAKQHFTNAFNHLAFVMRKVDEGTHNSD